MGDRPRWWKDRWFVLAMMAVAINGYGVFRYANSTHEDVPSVGIQTFVPGDQAQIDGLDPLVWQFAEDQVSQTQVGVVYPFSPFTITPAVEGTWTWDTRRTLRFAPENPWPTCTAYHIDANTDLFSVTTAPLKLQSIQQVHVTPDHRVVLGLEFNDPPQREDLTQHLTIQRTRGGEIVPFAIVGGVSTRTVRIQVRSMVNANLWVTLARGLRGTSGPLGLVSNQVHEVQVSRSFTLRRMQPISHSFESGEVRVELTHYLDPSAIPQYVTIDPPVSYAIKPYGRGFRIQAPFQAGRSYAISLQAGLPSRTGARLATNITRTVYFPDRPAGVTFDARGEHLSSAGSRLVALRSVNARDLTITAERIYPNNLVQFAMRRVGNYGYSRRWQHDEDGVSQVTGSLTVNLAGAPANQVVTNRIDLTKLMGDYESGAYQLTALTKDGRRARRLVVVSDIGIAAKRSAQDLLIWANSLRSLKPITNAAVRVFSRANQELAQGQSDTNGLFHISTPTETPFLVTVQTGDDIAYLSLEESAVKVSGETGGRPYLNDGYEAYVFTDRGIYRPGETAQVHTIVRDAAMDCAAPFPVTLDVLQPDGRLFRTHQGTLSELGTVGFSVAWPDYVPTGRYTLQLKLPGAKTVIGSTAVAVEAFVPPGIAVDLLSDTNRVAAGRDLAFDVNARHLFGPPAARLMTTGKVVFRPAPFSPTAWSDYHFGDTEKKFSQEVVVLGKHPLDEEGRATFRSTIPTTWRPPAAISALLVGTVQETGGRTVSAFASQLVDPYPHYIGIKLGDKVTRIPVGEQQRVELVAVQPNGALTEAAGPLQVSVQQIDWLTAMRERDGRFVYESERRLTPFHQSQAVLEGGKGSVTFTVEHSGSYLVQVTDPSNGASSSIQVYASTPNATYQPWSMQQPDQVDLEFDRDSYQPGDIGRLLIKSPFAGKALLTVETDHVLESRVIDLDENTREIEIPVSGDYLPNVYCSVTVLRPVVARDLWVPHRAVGVIPLPVSAPEERLAVAIEAPQTTRPLEPLTVQIQVHDASNQPVSCEVVLAAVDEGICRLTNFQTPDPLGFFRAKRRLGVHLFDLYGNLLPEIEAVLDGTASTPGSDMMGAVRGRLNPIRARRFKPTALWSGPVTTDAAGRATIELNVPEFTGQLRLMAVAIARRQFGAATASVTVKRSLVVRNSLPRFLAPNDRSTLSLQVFNETGSPQDVAVKIRCEGPLSISTSNSVMTLATGEDRNQTIPLIAATEPGLARVHLDVQGGGETYRETIELAVRPLSPRIHESGFGVVEPNQQVHLTGPSGWLQGTARQEVWCSGLPLLKLAGGLDYLLRYPYGCVEQTTSSSFPLLYLADLAELVQPNSMGRDETAAYVESGIHRLLSMQKANGSFGYWSHASEAYPFGSIYATHFLVEANRADHPVPADRLTAALNFLQALLDKTSDDSRWHEDRGQRAYACYVLALADRSPTGWISRLREEHSRLSVSANLHIIAALALTGQRADAGRLLESVSPDGAPYAEPGVCLDSPVRDQALMLSTWLQIDPHHPSVARLAQQLEAASDRGRWSTTHENAVCLLALGKYSRFLRNEQTAFTASASWQEGVASQPFTHETPLHITPADGESVSITNQGPGRLYYYWQASGVVASGDISELDRRLTVRRQLLDQDGAPLATNHFAQGDLIVIRLDIDTQGQSLDQLVITDLLPAGLEIENPAAVFSPQHPWIPKKNRLSVLHTDARDDRLLLFTGKVTGNRHYHYTTRAVTPGQYGYAPIAAEGMYDPEVRSVHGKSEITVDR